jgi:hypothetical protein
MQQQGNPRADKAGDQPVGFEVESMRFRSLRVAVLVKATGAVEA